MIKYKLKRKIIGTLLLLLILVSNVQSCFAADVSFGSLSSGSGSVVETEIPFVETDWGADYTTGDRVFQYKYKKRILSSKSISINGYDLDGNSVMPSSTTIDSSRYKFKSGTWIGINVIETQWASWEVKDYQFQEKRKKYVCYYNDSSEPTYSWVTINYCYSSQCPDGLNYRFNPFGNSDFGECEQYKQTGTSPVSGGSYTTENDYAYNYNENPCNSTYNGQTFKEYETIPADPISVDDTQLQNAMKAEANGEAATEARSRVGSPMGVVEYIDPSSGTGFGSLYGYLIDKTGNWGDSPGATGEVTKKYEYKKTSKDADAKDLKVCMNVKEASVTYGSTNCNTEAGEVQINNFTANGLNFWHYFIPLDTKSGDDEFFIRITGNINSKLSVDECVDAMEKYADNYSDYISPSIGGEPFEGDYGRLGEESSDYDKITTPDGNGKTGCYFSTSIYIPTTQKFYNEINSEGDIKGFNFYYRPIDIDNPFPNVTARNPLPSSSVWKDWYDSATKNPNISQSYDTISYIAYIGKNAKALREYNSQDNENGKGYGNWDNIGLDGKSSFIQDDGNEGFVMRKNIGSLYKLGCGVGNTDSTKTYLYQGWCTS